METQNTKDQLAKNVIEEGENVQVVWLDGKAPTQHNPEPVSISGTITAPSSFIEKRRSVFESLKSHCMVSKTDGVIQLIVNEQSVVNKFTITGKIAIGKKFLELGINSDKSYEPKQLAKKFKMLRSIFESRGEHTSIIATLNNLKAKIQREIEDSDDKRGNTNISFKQTVTSNMPESFTLSLPLIEGEEAEKIEVAVILEASGGDILCFLESVEGQEKIDQITEKLVDEEVSKIEADTTIIYY